MNNYVLFSPIGRSDPIRGNYDGPFLHILRHFNVTRAYLFLTSEICGYADHDKTLPGNHGKDRYTILAEKLRPDCQIEMIPQDDIKDPSQFDIFYPIFEKALSRICEKNPDATLLVNISSGTGQMQSSLEFLCATLKLPLKPVQVRSPAEKGNDSKSVGLVFDVESEWAALKDNIQDPKIKNRCNIVSTPHEIALFSRLAAKNLVANYNYRGALDIFEKINGVADQKLIDLLNAAMLRISLKADESISIAESSGFNDIFPIKENPARDIFELILNLQIKSKRGEILDFARGVSPVLAELFINYLNEVYQINIIDYCIPIQRKNKDSYYLLIDKKLQASPEIWASYNKTFVDGFRNNPLSFTNILPMVEYCCDKAGNCDDITKAKKLHDFEEIVRNKAAHQIIGIDEKTLINEYGYSSEEILEFLRYFFAVTFCKYATNMDWHSYGRLNEKIFKLLGV
jgi:CRISPR type III-A/MTUBE-associated protein Csm6